MADRQIRLSEEQVVKLQEIMKENPWITTYAGALQYWVDVLAVKEKKTNE